MIHDSVLMAEWLRLAGFAIFDGFDSEANVASQFNVIPSKVDGVIAALYGQESYEGSAFVLLVKEGKLYEVNGSHCSCYGLEGQWDEEETSIEALRKRTWPSGLNARTHARMTELLDLLEAL